MFTRIDDPHKTTIFISSENIRIEAEKSSSEDGNRKEKMDKPYRKIMVATRIR
jgi:hypothetical protein